MWEVNECKKNVALCVYLNILNIVSPCCLFFFFLSIIFCPSFSFPCFLLSSFPYPPPPLLLPIMFLLYLLLFLLAASSPCSFPLNLNPTSPSSLILPLLCLTVSVSSNFCLSNSNSLYLFCHETICGYVQRRPVFRVIGFPMMLSGVSSDIHF